MRGRRLRLLGRLLLALLAGVHLHLRVEEGVGQTGEGDVVPSCAGRGEHVSRRWRLRGVGRRRLRLCGGRRRLLLLLLVLLLRLLDMLLHNSLHVGRKLLVVRWHLMLDLLLLLLLQLLLLQSVLLLLPRDDDRRSSLPGQVPVVVRLQLVLPAELFTAALTLKGLLSRVGPAVAAQVGSASELGLAKVAGEGLALGQLDSLLLCLLQENQGVSAITVEGRTAFWRFFFLTSGLLIFAFCSKMAIFACCQK